MKQLSDYNFFSTEVLECPYEFYKLARENSPVMELPSELVGGKLFLVTSYDLVKQILLNVEVFSSHFFHLLAGKEVQSPEVQEIAAQGWPPVNTLLTADPPEHERFRSLVNQAFTTYRVNKMEGHIKLIVDELIDSLIDKGECEFISSFAVPLPLKVIARQLGVPPEDLPKFKKWSDSSIARLGRRLSKEQELECALDVLALQRYLNEVIEQCRKQPGDDLITDLVQAKVEGQRPLDTAELISIIQQLLVAGNETITNALAGGMLLLIQNPQQMALVQEAPDRLENLVEEVLRLETPTAGMWRIVKKDTELAGVAIPEGSVLLLRFDSANRDSKIFPYGEHFEVGRSNAANHLAFGHGIHFCVGAALARKEMLVAYGQLLRRLKNIRLAAGKNDLTHFPNVLMRGLKHLYIEFEEADARLK